MADTAGRARRSLGIRARTTLAAVGVVAAALLVAIFPANLWQAWEAWRDHAAGEASTAYAVGTLVRLPLQLPLVWWAWRAGRQGTRL